MAKSLREMDHIDITYATDAELESVRADLQTKIDDLQAQIPEGGVVIPTSRPTNLQNGMIWIE